jgi:hypothetical protein
MYKMWYTCTVEYYSAMKKNGAEIHAAMWMTLEDFALCKGSQTQQALCWMSPFV